jgi:hypothetical protein
MPFKSKAQRRKFAELLVKGEISAETYEEWNRSTGSQALPERVQSTKGVKRKRKATPKAASKRPTRKTTQTPRTAAARKPKARRRR